MEHEGRRFLIDGEKRGGGEKTSPLSARQIVSDCLLATGALWCHQIAFEKSVTN